MIEYLICLIVEGLEPGEEVVAGVVLKVDAAAQLEAKIRMMNPNASEPPMLGWCLLVK